MQFYLVGGAVRDLYIGRLSKDIDFAVECESYEELLAYLHQNRFAIFQERREFFTIRARFPVEKEQIEKVLSTDFAYLDDLYKLSNNNFKGAVGLTVDFVICRKDGSYSDNRHPDYVEMGTIYDDLSRRDFTMNAIAISLSDGKVIDPYNGREDIQDEIILCVEDARKRLKEDPLRVLRALRFSVQLGFDIDDTIHRVFRDSDLPALLSAVSTDRIREELTKGFKAGTLKMINLIAGLPNDLQSAIFSNGLWLEATTKG